MPIFTSFNKSKLARRLVVYILIFSSIVTLGLTAALVWPAAAEPAAPGVLAAMISEPALAGWWERLAPALPAAGVIRLLGPWATPRALLIYLLGYGLTAGLLSRPFAWAVKPGSFPRDVRTRRGSPRRSCRAAHQSRTARCLVYR